MKWLANTFRVEGRSKEGGKNSMGSVAEKSRAVQHRALHVVAIERKVREGRELVRVPLNTHQNLEPIWLPHWPPWM